MVSSCTAFVCVHIILSVCIPLLFATIRPLSQVFKASTIPGETLEDAATRLETLWNTKVLPVWSMHKLVLLFDKFCVEVVHDTLKRDWAAASAALAANAAETKRWDWTGAKAAVTTAELELVTKLDADAAAAKLESIDILLKTYTQGKVDDIGGVDVDPGSPGDPEYLWFPNWSYDVKNPDEDPTWGTDPRDWYTNADNPIGVDHLFRSKGNGKGVIRAEVKKFADPYVKNHFAKEKSDIIDPIVQYFAALKSVISEFFFTEWDARPTKEVETGSKKSLSAYTSNDCVVTTSPELCTIMGEAATVNKEIVKRLEDPKMVMNSGRGGLDATTDYNSVGVSEADHYVVTTSGEEGIRFTFEVLERRNLGRICHHIVRGRELPNSGGSLFNVSCL